MRLGEVSLAARPGLSRRAFPTIFGLFGWTYFLAANRLQLSRKML
jgi:hypothetical protein